MMKRGFEVAAEIAREGESAAKTEEEKKKEEEEKKKQEEQAKKVEESFDLGKFIDSMNESIKSGIDTSGDFVKNGIQLVEDVV